MFCMRTRSCAALALMTQKSCAVGMHNAKLGNHLKLLPDRPFSKMAAEISNKSKLKTYTSTR